MKKQIEDFLKKYDEYDDHYLPEWAQTGFNKYTEECLQCGEETTIVANVHDDWAFNQIFIPCKCGGFVRFSWNAN